MDYNIIGLKDLSVKEVKQIGNARIEFETTLGRKFLMYHEQDCCEYVAVESITGDLNNLKGKILDVTEEILDNKDPEHYKSDSCHDDSFTWTIFTFKTKKGEVTIRWLGESNGYYSESVSFAEIT